VHTGIARQNGWNYDRDMQTISLKLPDDLLAQLEREAKVRGITKSLLVRQSLEAALRRESPAGKDSCYDRAHDLAGIVKGMPRETADNPADME
jgi:hypothetical protein